MQNKKPIVYPYIPNSVPAVRSEMLEAIGAQSTDELYEDIPEALRLMHKMDLPEPFLSEYALRRHVEGILDRNTTCKEYLNFRGAGCWQHYVPAVCDEINGRSEFLTAYAGEPYEDHGRFQACFEYTSMMAELLEMDVVNVPTYDGFQAAATSIRMAARMTGRQEVLLPATIRPGLFSKLQDYCEPAVTLKLVDFNRATGLVDINAIKAALSTDTAAIFFENPSYLGFIETQGAQISTLAHEHGAECIVYADPISLGVLAPPSAYGADIVCGDIQPLGMHMNFGGGHAGYIATRDEVRYVMEYPSRLFGVVPTTVEGEYGFGDVAYERTSFAIREAGKEWVGTAAALWGITAGVYMALMGPQGFAEIGEGIMQRARYAAMCIDAIEGVKAPLFHTAHFKEFVVSFDGTGKSVKDINAALLEGGIFGGKDLSREFPVLGNSALFCITEVHTRDDIEQLAGAIEEAVR
ncbi:MAG: aminomethyl-transferring glycine dehydrogenase subunit GcvPA [Anaerolineaceae bacterium]|nr:aminomethyl-transferring glycine dehydrogenase subunit GcvPA [Anaerolineaceae bacterium]